MNEIKKIVKKYKLILFEDTCESLGSKFNNNNLGTIGDLPEHCQNSIELTSNYIYGEGGMVVCKNKRRLSLY